MVLYLLDGPGPLHQGVEGLARVLGQGTGDPARGQALGRLRYVLLASRGGRAPRRRLGRGRGGPRQGSSA